MNLVNVQDIYSTRRIKKDGETIGIGSPGGNRIPQVLTPVLDKYTHGKGSLQDIVDGYRFTFEKIQCIQRFH